MLFTSAVFLFVFLPATVAVYWAAPRRLRVPLLLVASYAFYLSWKPAYGLLLATSTVVNFAIARRIAASRSRSLLAAGVGFNLGVLAFFKYSGLLTSSAADLLDWLGLARSGSYDGLQIALPLAISFFTFEMISVQVDSWRGEIRVGGFLGFATYKAFFPKLLSGPITRYGELVPQLERPAGLDLARFQSGLALIAFGLAKKLALANNLALLANPVFDDPAGASAGAAALGILAFGFQIYFDFSAYTDIARGAARLVGLELPRNFRFPYAARSPREFWRHWHMSLSRWLRDYLYIPLGGNRGGRAATYRNLMITMALGGLWHGAAWHFAAWGTMHGAFLAIDRAIGGSRRAAGRAAGLAGWALTMAAVFVAWVFFRADSLGQALQVLGALTHLPAGLGAATPVYSGLTVAAALGLVLGGLALSRPAPRVAEWGRALVARRQAARGLALATLTVGCWTVAGVLAPSLNTPFVYFRF